jgi:hypothetical protein
MASFYLNGPIQLKYGISNHYGKMVGLSMVHAGPGSLSGPERLQPNRTEFA